MDLVQQIINKLRVSRRVIIINKKLISYHRYIWELFNGPIPNGFIVHHMDENKDNNDISNLKIMTYKEHNNLHKNGKYNKGRVAPNKGKKQGPMSQEQKNKISKEMTGKMTGEKNPMFRKNPWNKGLKNPSGVHGKIKKAI